MKFPYIVNKDGVYYPAGTDVPVGEKPVENKKIDEVKEVIEKKSDYTKTEINRMSTAELKTLAKSENIDNAEDMTGAELKKVLIEHFNL